MQLSMKSCIVSIFKLTSLEVIIFHGDNNDNGLIYSLLWLYKKINECFLFLID